MTELSNAELHDGLRRAELGLMVSDYANTLRGLKGPELRIHALISYQQVLELQQALQRAEQIILTQQTNLTILTNSPTIQEIS